MFKRICVGILICIGVELIVYVEVMLMVILTIHGLLESGEVRFRELFW
jgi:hypothetical protein